MEDGISEILGVKLGFQGEGVGYFSAFDGI